MNATTTFSQTYLNIPGNSISESSVLEDTQTLSIEQHNIGTDTIQLKWSKINESVPANWDVNVCDNSTCYPNLVDSGTMLPIFPGDYGLLLIHCTPHIQPGIATIQYAVWDTVNPAIIDTLTYMITAVATGIPETTSARITFSLTGNELSINGNIESYKKLKIFDLNGKIVVESAILDNNVFKLPYIHSAAYIIQLAGKGKIFQQKIIYQP